MSCFTSQQNPYIGGLVVAGLLKLKGAAFDAPFSDMVDITIHGLRSILLKSTSIKSIISTHFYRQSKNDKFIDLGEDHCSIILVNKI